MARQDDEYLKAYLKQRNRCLGFVLADFLLFCVCLTAMILVGKNYSSDNYAMLGIALSFDVYVFPLYAAVHGIFGYLGLKRILLPSAILWLFVYLSILGMYMVDWWAGSSSEGSGFLLLLVIIPVSGVYAGISAICSLITRGIMK